nr:translation initiation factor IF-2 [Taeniopygia guttata]
MLGAARLAVPLFCHNSANTFQAPRSETDTEPHRASQGSGQRGPQPAGAGSALRPPARPAASRRLGGVTSPGVSGTYVTPRGRRCCCCFPPFPKTNSFPRAPNSLSALGQASARRRRFPPRVLPAPPPASLPAGRGAAPAPGGTAEPSAASHRGAPSPRAAPGSQHGRERAAGVPAEKGSARKVSLSLPGRPRPKPSPGAQNAAGQCCSPGTPRSGRRLPYPPHGRGHTPHAVGRAPGHRPAGRGRRHLGREGRAARPRLPAERPERAGRNGTARLGPARPGPRVAPRGSGRLPAPDRPAGAFLRDVLYGRSRVCVRARGS